jgi:DNA-binding NtrC family response regulator
MNHERKTMETDRKILVVDDYEPIREGLRIALGEFGYMDVDDAPDAETALEKVLLSPPDVIIVDLNLPGKSGLELVADLQQLGIETTAIVLTAHGSIDSAVQATRRGVFEYLSKPITPAHLRSVVDRAMERTALRREVLQLRREMLRAGHLSDLVGRSPAMLEIYRLIEQVAPTSASVLITGASGTGKEVIARTLHRLSQRATRTMVAVNCAAIPATLLESELFGHEKGAFTGATASRTGRFEEASGSTLFLDEIGEMPVDLQSKLLRSLEDRKVRRVGGDRDIPIDVRVISATNAPLETLLRDGKLREDLYFRLNVFMIAIPPLRERTEDIPVLAEHFLQEHLRENPAARVVGFSEGALQRLKAYPWPGNVRELRNAVQRAAIMCGEGEIQPEHLPPSVRGGEPVIRSSARGVLIAPGTSMDEAEKAIILDTLRQCEGHKARTAEILGISLKTLYTRLNLYESEKQEGSTEVS